MIKLKVVFMGTPDFSVPTLEKLQNSKHEVLAVITQPDKPNARGKKIRYSPVKQFAIDNNIDILQPKSIKSNETYKILEELKPDVIVVVAYGQIIPKSILDLPKYGCINIHASLLPRYRGAAPIHWSIINGENETGVTTMHMSEGLDTGDMIFKSSVKIEEEMNVGDLHDELSILGAQLLIETLVALEDGTAPSIKQDDKDSNYAEMIDNSITKINWNKSTRQIFNLIRGTCPWPVAHCFYDNKRIKIYSAKIYEEKVGDFTPGTIIEYIKNEGLLVKTGDGGLLIQEIQFPNKKKMHIDQFLLGNNIDMNKVFE